MENPHNGARQQSPLGILGGICVSGLDTWACWRHIAGYHASHAMPSDAYRLPGTRPISSSNEAPNFRVSEGQDFGHPRVNASRASLRPAAGPRPLDGVHQRRDIEGLGHDGIGPGFQIGQARGAASCRSRGPRAAMSGRLTLRLGTRVRRPWLVIASNSSLRRCSLRSAASAARCVVMAVFASSQRTSRAGSSLAGRTSCVRDHVSMDATSHRNPVRLGPVPGRARLADRPRGAKLKSR